MITTSDVHKDVNEDTRMQDLKKKIIKVLENGGEDITKTADNIIKLLR